MTHLPECARPRAQQLPIAGRSSRALATWIATLCLLTGALLVESRGWAGGVVTGCSEQALTNALAGGGLVTFTADCSLTVTHTIYIGAGSTTISNSGGHQVTISGGSQVPIFSVAGHLTLHGITLANGKSTNVGGAMYISPSAVVAATNCIFAGNSVAAPNGIDGAGGSTNSVGSGGNGGNGTSGSSAAGGAICNQGTLTLVTCVLSNNTATAGNGGLGGRGGDSGGSLGQGGDGGSGGAGANSYGGAVYSSGTLTLVDCTVAGNSAVGGTGSAGGAAGSGTFAGQNGAGAAGGGGYGGGIYNGGSMSLLTSALSGNSTRGGNSAAGGTRSSGTGTQGPDGGAAYGGSLCSASWGEVINCTFYNNTATGGTGGTGGNGTGTFPTAGRGGNGGNGVGGCIQNFATLTIVNCTILVGSATGGTNGFAGSGTFGGGDGQPGQAQGGNVANSSGSFTLRNSLFAWPPSGGCGYGTFSDGGYNLTTDTTISLVNHGYPNIPDPKLGGFGMHGGPTATVPLLTNSYALDKIPTNFPATDQRGVPRPLPAGGKGDIGAYESEDTSPPFILRQPADQTGTNGYPATFSVSALGASPLHYQWFLQTNLIANATGSSYTIAAVFSTNQGPYHVVITNTLGSATSSIAMVNLAVSIAVPPTNQVVLAGTDVSFEVLATGDAPLSYQWLFNSNVISGATNSYLELPAVQVTNNVGTYTVSISNHLGGVVSTPVTLNIAPTILTQPSGLTVSAGGQAIFRVSATGSPPLIYRWSHNGLTISGATFDAYTNNNVQASDAGTYQVRISNGFGMTNSAAVSLNVVGVGISGSVYEGTNGLPGVNVAIGTNQGIVTGPDGTYSASVPAGTYVLTPTLTNYAFSPGSWTLALTVPTNNINFSGLPLIRLTLMTNGSSQIYGGGITGLTYQVEASTNLLQWQPISTNVAPIQFTDPASGLPQKFYRFSR